MRAGFGSYKGSYKAIAVLHGSLRKRYLYDAWDLAQVSLYAAPDAPSTTAASRGLAFYHRRGWGVARLIYI